MATKPFWDRFGKVHYGEEETATRREAYYAIIIKADRVLLTVLPKYDLFEFPGGSVERGEDFRGCLLREFYEETGYDFGLTRSEKQIHQRMYLFADEVKPRGECRICEQTYFVYDADNFGLGLKEGEWKTPENGRAKWVKLSDLAAGKIPINYCHRLAFEKYLGTNS